MNHYASAGRSKAAPEPSRILIAGGVHLDEARGELRVAGGRRTIEAKPLALLHALMSSGGSIVGKRTLIAAAWGNADHISEASLTTAMSKLRTALGSERGLIEVVHGQGYRLARPVEVQTHCAPAQAGSRFEPGQAVPGRPDWYLQHPLRTDEQGDAWLAHNETTAEQRVFKFALSDERLEALEREVAIAQQLKVAIANGDAIVPIIDWNFDELPYFIERPYGGPSLAGWARATRRLDALDLPQRITMVAELARLLAAAHAAGIVHGDLRPETILVDDSTQATPRLRLVDFPAGQLSDPAQASGDEDGADPGHPPSWISSEFPHAAAPEVQRGAMPSAGADVYSLGILLYQMVISDLDKPLAAGWEEGVSDVLLRQDIAAAAAGDPTRRLESAIQLAELLETLPRRNLLQRQQQRQQAHQAELLRQIERSRARQPWIIGAAMSALAGVVISTGFAIRAAQERDLSDRRAALVEAVNTFLTEDLLSRGNPALSGKADETLMQAASAAEASIDRRFGNDPLTAGAIYLSLADAYAGRAAFSAATNAYDHAVASFHKAGKQGDASRVIARLRESAVLVVSAQPASMARASALIAEASPDIAKLRSRMGEATVWLHNALAMQQMLGGDLRVAQIEFGKAADGADTLPKSFNDATRLAFRRREAFAYLRLGDWPVARDMMSELLRRQRAVSGISHPDTLQLELNLAQVQLNLGDAATALSTLDRIYPDFVAVFGPDHRLTLGLLGERANAFDNLGRYSEAFADQMHAYHAAVQTDGEHSLFALGSLSDAAQSRCRAGRPDLGRGLAQAAYADARSSFGAESLITQALGGNLALCLIAAGQPEGAWPLLEKIDARLISQMSMDQTYGAQLEVMRAAIHFAAGDLPAGQASLARAAPTFARPNADPYMHKLTIDLLKTYGSHPTDGTN